MDLNFSGKVVLVTGGTVGIGRTVCEEFLKNGASVVFASRSPEEGMKVNNEFKKISSQSHYIKCDVSKEEDVKNLINETISKFSKIDILVNNAAVFIFKIMHECSIDDFNFAEKRPKNTFLDPSKFIQETGFEFIDLRECYNKIARTND